MRGENLRAARLLFGVFVILLLITLLFYILPAAASAGNERMQLQEDSAGRPSDAGETGLQLREGVDGSYVTKPEIDPEDWRLRLVNHDNPMDEAWDDIEIVTGEGIDFDYRAYGALVDMLAAGEAEGLQFVVCSSYRSVEYQSMLFERQILKQMGTGLSYDDAVEAAGAVVIYPGHSEHNLGLAADIVALDYQVLDDGYADTDEAQWLRANCAEYGFILRYPEDKQDITGIIFEPWHFRYVGVEHARYIMETGICLEEYLDKT